MFEDEIEDFKRLPEYEQLELGVNGMFNMAHHLKATQIVFQPGGDVRFYSAEGKDLNISIGKGNKEQEKEKADERDRLHRLFQRKSKPKSGNRRSAARR